MNQLFAWLDLHWGELLTLIGVGGTSGFAGKKLTDKRQDAKIESLILKVGKNEERINIMENELKTNTLFDKQFREQMKDDRVEMREMLKEIKEHQAKIYDYLLNSKK